MEVKEEVTIPDVVGLSLQEAQKLLKEQGIEVQVNNEAEDLDKSSVVVKTQTPQPGIIVYKGNTVYLDY